MPPDSPDHGSEVLSNPAWSRLRMRVGAQGLQRLAGARVAVVGLGAVGSFAVEALARSGIGTLRLVDFDDIKPSNLNRQLYALTSTLGRYKVDVAVERVRDINPAVNVEGMRRFFDSSSADDVLDGVDHVVDAIDSLTPKVTLIAACVTRGIPIVSAMGAADRTDPTRLRVTDLFESGGCPLARHVRKRLRRLGIESGPVAVWSDESTAVVRPDDSVPADAPPEEEAMRRGRDRRPLPSMAPMPAIFGLTAANHVILTILGKEVQR